MSNKTLTRNQKLIKNREKSTNFRLIKQNVPEEPNQQYSTCVDNDLTIDIFR